MEIICELNGIILGERKFNLYLLQEFGVMDLKPVDSPLDPSDKLILNEGSVIPNSTLYWILLGKLNFLTHTHPYMFFAIQHLNQFINPPDNLI